MCPFCERFVTSGRGCCEGFNFLERGEIKFYINELQQQVRVVLCGVPAIHSFCYVWCLYYGPVSDGLISNSFERELMWWCHIYSAGGVAHGRVLPWYVTLAA